MNSWLQRFHWVSTRESSKRGSRKRCRCNARNRRRTILEQLEGRNLLAAVPFSTDFSGFTGSGFAPTPVAGQLDSDDWRVTGLSDGAGTFSGTHTTGDFARGSSAGGVTTGGVYAFNVGGGVTALGFQPGGSDFTPGTLTLKIDNTTSELISDWGISYDIFTFNDQGRASSFNFQYSTDDSTYTSVASLDFTTPEAADTPVAWVPTPRSIELLGVPVAVGESLYLQWFSNDVSGGGNRDEFGISNINVGEFAAILPPAAILSPNVAAVNVTEGQAGETFALSFSELPQFDVTVTISPDNSQIDLGAGAGNHLVLTFTTTNATDPQNFSVTAFDDTDVEGTHSSGLTFLITSADSMFDSLVLNPITVTIFDNDFTTLVAPYRNDFETAAGPAGLGEGWTTFSVDTDTDRTWAARTESGNRFAEGNSFGGSAPADDWLISPAFDLDATVNEAVSFRTQTSFTDMIPFPQLDFRYSTNYRGTGDPNAATWTSLPFTPSPENSGQFTESGDIDVSSISGSEVWFAFRYQSSGTGSGESTRWRVDDFSLVEVTAESSFVLINEILFDPPGGDTPYEFVELRGDADTVIPAGTYLINIEGDTSSGFGPGKVSNIFDLSGLAFGANGYLVLAQDGNGYMFDSGANVLTSSTSDFGGFSFFQSDVAANQIENATNSLLLVSSPTPPSLSDDVDSDNDGVLDGSLASGWTLLDGVSVSDGDAGDLTYAPVVFTGASLGYVARNGNSTGMTQADWVGAAISGSGPNFTLAIGGTIPSVLGGRALDHIGGDNPATAPVTPGAPVPFSENFESFTGAGFVPEPSAGQLDSDFWRVTGMSDATGEFSVTFDSGDFARGESPGGVTSGGVYAFDTGDNIILGFQPTGDDFTPGTVTLKLTNDTGSKISDWAIGYDIFTLNNTHRANSLNFEYSLDDTTYTPVSGLDFTTPEAADSEPTWVSTPRTTVLTGVSVDDGGTLYLRWVSSDVSGSGSRDEFGIDNVSVNTGAPADTTPPTITNVIVASSLWSDRFIDIVDGDSNNGLGLSGLGLSLPGADQMRNLPWTTGIDTFYLEFSEDVSASFSPSLFSLIGNRTDYLPTATFSYGVAGPNVVTIQLAVPIFADALILSVSDQITDAAGNALDGEWQDTVSLQSGNGTAGGQFNFRIDILAGDVDDSGGVNLSGDVVAAFGQNGLVVTSLAEAYFDVDASGGVNLSGDVLAIFGFNGTTLPTAPTAPDLSGGGFAASSSPGWPSSVDAWMSLLSDEDGKDKRRGTSLGVRLGPACSHSRP